MSENVELLNKLWDRLLTLNSQTEIFQRFTTLFVLSNKFISDEANNLVLEVAQHLGDNVRKYCDGCNRRSLRGQDVKIQESNSSSSWT